MRRINLAVAVAAAGLLAAGCGGGSGGGVVVSTFNDNRDGQTYKAVKIGNQTWMAENLRFNAGGSWCYEKKENNCDKYGRLYDWNMAKTACPNGWHIPSKDEWAGLLKAAGGFKKGGKTLKATSGWQQPLVQFSSSNGTDEYNFSALPGGMRDSYGFSNFKWGGNEGNWWGAAESSDGNAYYLTMNSLGNEVFGNYGQKTHGFSVRCIKDN